jgi:hypothetical protein
VGWSRQSCYVLGMHAHLGDAILTCNGVPSKGYLVNHEENEIKELMAKVGTLIT